MSPSAVMSNTFSPTSMPVSRPVSGSGSMGTSAHQKETYHPSAALLIVTVLIVPWIGRDQRAAIRPIFARIREPLSRRAPLPYSFVGERVVAILAVESGKAGLLAAGHAAEEGVIGLLQARQHILHDMRVEGAVFGQLRPQGFQLAFLLIARDGHAALLPQEDALRKRSVVEDATAPQDLRKLALLCVHRPQLLLSSFSL